MDLLEISYHSHHQRADFQEESGGALNPLQIGQGQKSHGRGLFRGFEREQATSDRPGFAGHFKEETGKPFV